MKNLILFMFIISVSFLASCSEEELTHALSPELNTVDNTYQNISIDQQEQYSPQSKDGMTKERAETLTVEEVKNFVDVQNNASKSASEFWTVLQCPSHVTVHSGIPHNVSNPDNFASAQFVPNYPVNDVAIAAATQNSGHILFELHCRSKIEGSLYRIVYPDENGEVFEGNSFFVRKSILGQPNSSCFTVPALPGFLCFGI